MTTQRHTTRVAVYVLLIKDNKLFLIRRKNTGWMDGYWGVPAGHLEQRETLMGAAIREAKEESGVDLVEDNLEFVHLMHRDSAEGFEYVDVFFVANKWTNDPFLSEPQKSDKVEWFSLDELPKNIVYNQLKGIESYVNKVAFSEIIY